MPARTPACSIVIPLYNQVDYTRRCLETLVAHTPEDRYEVVLVDNASTDATGELLAVLEGDVTVIRNERNLGFAVACNQGAQAARGDVLVFLNNDVELLPDWLDGLLGQMERDPQVGAVGAKLLYPDGTLQHAGMWFLRDHDAGVVHAFHKWPREAAHLPPANRPGPVPAVTGALLAVRRQAFEQVGGFDEGYWNGLEDVDLCLSLWEAGWVVRYEPSCTAIHHESVSGPERWARVDDNVRRFAERWFERVRPHLEVRGGKRERVGEVVPPLVPVGVDPGEAAGDGAAGPRPVDVLAFVGRLADGEDLAAAEAVARRVQLAEERRLLEVVRAGRDVCWVDEGEDEPLVTITIPTYNRGRLVAERAIASALAQTYENVEVLVVGDCCDAATEEAVRSVDDPRVRFVNLPARGIYPEDPEHRWYVAGVDPANLGIELARGAWLTQCDDDDELTPDHVEVLLRAAREQRVEMVWSQARMEVAPGQWAVIGTPPLRCGQVTHGSVLYSLGLRFFRYSRTCWKLGQPADWNLWHRMLDAGVRIGFVPQVTYVHYAEARHRTQQPAA